MGFSARKTIHALCRTLIAIVVAAVCSPLRAGIDADAPGFVATDPADGTSAAPAVVDPQRIADTPYASNTEPFALNLPAPNQLDNDQHALRKLRKKWKLDTKLEACRDDLERIMVLSAWVHGLWAHDPWHVPEHPDPAWIVSAAARGERFRCQEYALVLSSALNAVEIPARMLSLMRADVEVAEYGAAHVAVEAYLRNERRWVFVDPQWDAVVTDRGLPMNAAELRQALVAGDDDLVVGGRSGDADLRYLAWIRPYLTFLSVPLYTRTPPPPEMPARVMLAPAGVAAPTVFQRSKPLGRMVVLHSPAAFYQPPAHAAAANHVARSSSPATSSDRRSGG